MRSWKAWLAGVTLPMMLAGPVAAMRIAPPPAPTRVATSDLVVVGKVTGFGPKLVKAELFKGDTRDLQIAVVKVEDTLRGKAGKEIKVGFVPPAGGPIRPGFRRGGIQLKVDQEGLFFLAKHPSKDLFILQTDYHFLNKQGNPAFVREVDYVRKCVKLLARPKDGLRSREADDRYLTAAMLIERYRTGQPGAKTERVPADESKLILTALAEANWIKPGPQFIRLSPQLLFGKLGLTAKDGWTPPRDFRQYGEEARKWLKDNAGKYRIRRYVTP